MVCARWCIGVALALAVASAAAATREATAVRAGTVAGACHDLALKRMRETGRTYDASRSGWVEKDRLFDIWIGRHLFRVPEGYVNVVGGGYPDGTAGIDAVLAAVLPDMQVAKPPYGEVIDGVEPVAFVILSCAPFEYATVADAAKRTREGYITKYLHVPRGATLARADLPAFRLIGYKSSAAPRTVYFPDGDGVRNPHGGALGIVCDEPYPPRTTAPRPMCTISYALRDGVHVEYRFPEHFLKYWRRGHERTVRILTAFLTEN